MKKHFLFIMLWLFYAAAHAQWQNVGTEGFSAGAAGNPVIATAPDGTPYVAYTDLAYNGKLSVMRYTGGTWQYVGAAGFTADSATLPSLTVDANGVPYVSFIDKSTSNKLTVMKYTSSSWSTVGTAGFATNSGKSVIKINNGLLPTVAYGNTSIAFQQFNGAGWVPLPAISLTTYTFAWDFTFNKITNEPFVIFSDNDTYNNKATVQKYNGSSWVLAGNRAFSSGGYGIYYASIECDAGGNVYVGIQDDDGPEKAAVYKLNGSTWVSVGPKFISAGHSYYDKIALSSSGVPYIIYSDVSNSSRPNFNATVLRYNGSIWQAVGPAGFIREYNSSGIAIAADGFPYVLNTTAAGKAKVVKYADNPLPTIKPTSQYTFLAGDSAYPFMMKTAGVGVASATNTPSGRYLHAGARNSSRSTLWIFGGLGFGSNNNYPATEYLNDLWQYQPAIGQWIQVSANRTDSKGIYGTKGVAAAANVPGKRYFHIAWMDAADNLWLFGGQGFDATGANGALNDLWKYTPSTGQWAWMSGDSTVNKPPVYGMPGSGTTSTKPGSRTQASACTDASGNLLLFGGNGYGGGGALGALADLWQYSVATGVWTWVSGDSTVSVAPVVGTQGVAAAANKPGSKLRTIMAADAGGNVWLVGGQYAGAATNLVWRYQTSTGQWTWMKGGDEQYGVYGTKGVSSPANTPGRRPQSGGDIDASGNIWIIGGNGYGTSETTFQSSGFLNTNDLWKYNTLTNEWTWVSGDNIMFQHGIYGIQGVASATNKPGGMLNPLVLTIGSDVYVFGGQALTKTGGFDAVNTMMRYAPSANSWTWLKGNNYSYSSYFGINGNGTAETRPSARSGHVTLRGNDGNLYLFGGNSAGGFNIGTGVMNDIWRYNPGTSFWSFMKGSVSPNFVGNYGTQGTTVSSNQPPARQQPASWKDQNGNLWLFGGINSGNTYLSDLWKYDITTNNWTWINGSNTTYQPGVYGTPGIASATNQPGSRFGTYAWADTSGNLWMFGGSGRGNVVSGAGSLSDLWKYNIASNLWTFVKGDSIPNKTGVYVDTLAYFDNTARPGGRQQGASWVDNAGNFCLFGGTGYSSTTTSGNLADIWKYNAASGIWTWMRGAKTPNPIGIYGTAGTYATANNPGGRWGTASTADQYGNLILFGGFGLTGTGGYDFMNDLWKYDNASNNWAYMKGQTAYGPTGIYSRGAGTASATASIGGRYVSGLWADNTAGKVYLYGGLGYTSNSLDGFSAIENDLWKLDEEMVTLPLKITRFTARLSQEDVLCNWVTTEEFSLSHFEVERSLNGSDFTKAGTVGAANSYTTYTYNFTDAGAAKLGTKVLYYRLKSVDKDGKYVYSGIVMIKLSASSNLPLATLYPNPVRKISYLNIETNQVEVVSIKAINSSGQQLFTRQISLAAGANSILVDCSGLPAGSYLLQVSGGTNAYAPIRFIKAEN